MLAAWERFITFSALLELDVKFVEEMEKVYMKAIKTEDYEPALVYMPESLLKDKEGVKEMVDMLLPLIGEYLDASINIH